MQALKKKKRTRAWLGRVWDRIDKGKEAHVVAEAEMRPAPSGRLHLIECTRTADHEAQRAYRTHAGPSPFYYKRSVLYAEHAEKPGAWATVQRIYIRSKPSRQQTKTLYKRRKKAAVDLSSTKSPSA